MAAAAAAAAAAPAAVAADTPAPAPPAVDDTAPPPYDDPPLVAIMGGIGVGKSRLLERLRADKRVNITAFGIVEEPLDLFTNVHGHGNLLRMLYENPKTAAAPFQQVAMYGLARSANDAWRAAHFSDVAVRLLLVERSIIDTHYIFSAQQRADGNIVGIDIGVEQVAFETLCATAPWVWPRAVVYLEASAETCWDRMLVRARPEEVQGSYEELKARQEYIGRLCTRYDDTVERLESGELRAPWGGRTPVVRAKEGDDPIAAVARACELACA